MNSYHLQQRTTPANDKQMSLTRPTHAARSRKQLIEAAGTRLTLVAVTISFLEYFNYRLGFKYRNFVDRCDIPNLLMPF